jgi:AraC-like DNA-binding protein
MDASDGDPAVDAEDNPPMTDQDRKQDARAAQVAAAPCEDVLGRPQIAIVLPPSPDGASFKAWQHHLTFACSAELVDPEDAPAFHASTDLYMLGRFMLSLSTSSHANKLVRSGEDVARTGVDHVNISLHLEGSYEGSCGRRSFHARQGDVSFIDFGMPFEFETSPYRTLALTVPRNVMPDGLRDRALHGLVPEASLPLTRLLAQLMRDVYEALPGMTVTQGEAAAAAIVEMALATSQGGYGLREERSPADLDLLGRAQWQIERSLADPGLTVGTLLARLNVSRGVLYGVFAEHGGVQAYIGERRLQRCYEVINGGDRADETLSAIAFSFGFRSEAHFSRSFKNRFGITPRDLRAVARQRSVDMMPPTTTGVPPDAIQTLGQ